MVKGNGCDGGHVLGVLDDHHNGFNRNVMLPSPDLHFVLE